jgi:uroporphyrinogen decarboxylase
MLTSIHKPFMPANLKLFPEMRDSVISCDCSAAAIHSDPPAGHDSLFCRAARGQPVERTPCWLMRQAGRYDPAYQRIRRDCGLELEDLFRHSKLAAELTALPARFGVDALILFQDILTPLAPLGAPFVYRPGPRLDRPLRTAEQVAQLRNLDPERDLPFVADSIARVRANHPDLPLLGFAGAPWTLAAFLVEGSSPHASGGHHLLEFARSQPHALRQLLAHLTETTIAYLRNQIQAGVQAVQLFESAADLLDAQSYATWALPYQQRIFAALAGSVPRLIFAKDGTDPHALAASGADILSLAHTVSLSAARRALGNQVILQGNVDNRLLLTGSPAQVRHAVRRCLEEGRGAPHILNLGHGILEGTPLANVQAFLEEARQV